MGLLNPSDWQAQWIGFDTTAENDSASARMKSLLNLEGSKWVWGAGAKPGNQAAGKMFFRKVIQLPPDRPVKQASFLLTADDSFRLFINGHQAGQGTTWKTLANPEVTGRLQPGANAIGIEVDQRRRQSQPGGPDRPTRDCLRQRRTDDRAH